MRGILVKFLFSLALLLLVGSQQLHYFYQSAGSKFQIEKDTCDTPDATTYTFESTQVISVPFYNSIIGHHAFIGAEKVEEEEKTSSYLDNFFFYNPLVTLYPFISSQSFLSFAKYQVFDTPYFSYLSFYNRCLIFEVFRL